MAVLRCLCLMALLSSSAFARPARYSQKAARALPSDHPDYVGLVILDEVDFPVPNPARVAKRWQHKPSATYTTPRGHETPHPHHPHETHTPHHHQEKPTHTQSSTAASASSSTTPGICSDYGLVTNGGLEDGFAGWSQSTSGAGSSGLTITDGSGSCYSGNKCFTVTNTAVPQSDSLTPWQADFTQTFDVTAGQTYAVSFASKGPGDTNAQVQVAVTFTTKSGQVVSTPDVPSVYPTADWAVTTFSVSAPSDAPEGLTATVDVKFIGETCIQDQVVSVDCVGMKSA